MVAQRSVDADETLLANFDAAGDDDMRSDKTVALDDRVVTDVIAAPQRHVVADRGERLDLIVFEDEPMVADATIVENARAPADEPCEPGVQRLRGELLVLAERV